MSVLNQQVEVMLRTLTPADVNAFRKIRNFGIAESPEAFNATLAEESQMTDEQVGFLLQERPAPFETFVVGAFWDEKLVGFGSFHREQLSKSNHKGVIWGMYVHPDVRGQKIGRGLLMEILLRAELAPGLEQIQLTVDANSKPAKKLYLSAGFTEFGYEKNAFRISSKQVDLIHMVKWC